MNLTVAQINSLQKLFNQGINRANSMLTYLSESPLCFQICPIKTFSEQQLAQDLSERFGVDQVANMELVIRGEFTGIATLVFPPDTSEAIVDIIAGEERRHLDQDGVIKRTIGEVGNIFFNGLMGVISKVLDDNITYMVPNYVESTVAELLVNNLAGQATILFGKILFKVDLPPSGIKKYLDRWSGLLPKQYANMLGNDAQSGAEIIFFFKVDQVEKLLANLQEEA